MILRPDFYHHAHDPREDSPPQLVLHPPPPPFPPPPPLVFPYPGPHPPFHDPFSSSYPRPAHSYPQQLPPFMPQQRAGPSYPRPVHPSLLNDPAFSPDPRSNPYFFSMNDREEIYPASLSDSLSDYASTAPDDESEVDHSNLPPRLRLLHSPDAPPQPLPGHARSQSAPYPPIAPHDQYLARSNTTRVIPVPPPISRTSTPGSHLRKHSHEDPRQNISGPSPIYASASLAARDVWQPPPPYPDSESSSSSSSSSPQQTPASSSSLLPRDAQRSTSSLTRNSAPPPEKSSPTRTEQPPSNTPSTRGQTQPESPTSGSKTSTVQSTAVRPPINARNASAPELHPPPPRTDVPPRPSTVPIPAPADSTVSAPVAQRKRSKNTSIAAPPRDLDRIDELDESDPLGLPWHHDGPYEAIMKAVPVLYPDQSILAKKRSEASSRPPKRKPVEPYDSLSLGVSPGQIFPSNSQYQPPTAGAQGDSGQRQAETRASDHSPPDGTPPSSPPLQVPVQRRMPSSGPLPSSPLLYNNVHMSAGQAQAQTQAQAQQQQQYSQQRQQPSQVQSQRPRHAVDEAPQPSPPLPNPYSPAESAFPNGAQAQSQNQSQGQMQRNSPPRPSPPPSRTDLPSSSMVPRPDIHMPPQQQQQQQHEQHSGKSSRSLLPRHLPKKLVMPAPLQPLQQQQQQQQNQAPSAQSGRGVGPGGAHIEVLAQRHVNHPPQSAPSVRTATSSMAQTQSQPQQQRAQDIPISQGPKVLRKRHTTGGASSTAAGGAGGETIPASNTTAALFAARVRFAEPVPEETKEERKKREKEEAKRQKELEKMEKERAKAEAKAKEHAGLFGGGGGIFVRDHVKEAELAREREMAKAAASVKSASGRKLSKRR
ncbi:hypothetical protein BV20DRAFT_1048409 [Pilatotrama ljubarskyi]|nr:hypothetical protein BV20DRAFT_1048409 [Pilatotrama ljubarskyi]